MSAEKYLHLRSINKNNTSISVSISHRLKSDLKKWWILRIRRYDTLTFLRRCGVLYNLVYASLSVNYDLLQHSPSGISLAWGHCLGCFSNVHRASVKIRFMWCSVPHTISSSISIFKASFMSTSKRRVLRIIWFPILSPLGVISTILLALYVTRSASFSLWSILTTEGGLIFSSLAIEVTLTSSPFHEWTISPLDTSLRALMMQFLYTVPLSYYHLLLYDPYFHRYQSRWLNQVWQEYLNIVLILKTENANQICVQSNLQIQHLIYS